MVVVVVVSLISTRFIIQELGITDYGIFSIVSGVVLFSSFISNSLMVKDSDFIKEQSEILPELYKDLFYEDKDGGIWMPSTVNLPNLGMIFAKK